MGDIHDRDGDDSDERGDVVDYVGDDYDCDRSPPTAGTICMLAGDLLQTQPIWSSFISSLVRRASSATRKAEHSLARWSPRSKGSFSPQPSEEQSPGHLTRVDPLTSCKRKT